MTNDEKLAQARAKFGRQFAADSTASSYKLPSRPVLDDWKADRITEAKKPHVFRPVDAKRRAA